MPENKLLHCGRVFQLNSRNIVGHFRLLERKKGKNKLGRYYSRQFESHELMNERTNQQKKERKKEKKKERTVNKVKFFR